MIRPIRRGSRLSTLSGCPAGWPWSNGGCWPSRSTSSWRLFTGGGSWLGGQLDTRGASWGGAGLIGLLAVVAAIVLAVTGRYPEQIFDFVLGLDRWVLRVAAYAGLMTDRYPPFRLDMGGHDPGTLTLPPSRAARLDAGTGGPPQGSAGRPGWTTARIISVVAGALAALVSVGLLGAGGTALWAQTQRHGGYVDLGTASYATSGYAIASDALQMHMARGGWDGAPALAGTVRIQVTSAAGSGPAFIGIAPAAAAQRYLAGCRTRPSRRSGPSGLLYRARRVRTRDQPAAAGIWAAQATGPGAQTLTWAVHSGDWMVVVMNADGSRPVAVQASAAATLPALPWVAAGLLTGGVICLVGGALLIVVSLQRASIR